MREEAAELNEVEMSNLREKGEADFDSTLNRSDFQPLDQTLT